MDAVTEKGMPSAVSVAVGVARLRRRAWPLATAAAFVIIGMAFSLLWAPVVRHHSYWVMSGDLWSTYRSAHFVGWGDLGGIYSAGTALVTFPGILFVLAPLAMVTGSLGMTEAFPKFVPHPTAWFALGTASLLLCAVSLFACDALAERLGISRRRRAVLCVAEAAALWNVAVIWGHPEDAIALSFALYALVFAFDGRWTGAGWLFGAAMATQPLVVLMFPVLLAQAGRGRTVGLAVRSAVPAAALVLTPLISRFHDTTHALLDQPNYPNLDHATPWTRLAPVLGGSGHDLAVAAGPGRIVAVILACGVGWQARRWRQRPDLMVWAAALALALRIFTESVLVAFYIWPVLAVGLVAAARAGRTRLAAAIVVSLSLTVVAQWHLGELPWWSAITVGLVALLALGRRTADAPAPAEPLETSFVERGSAPSRVLAGTAA